MLSEAFLGLVMFIVPALICGILLGLPSLLFVLVLRYSHRSFSEFVPFVIGLTAIFSFAIALLFATRSLIDLRYAVELPSSPNWAEKQLHYSAIINEATYRSLVPAYFQKSCTRNPEIVCKLGNMYAINLWSSHDSVDLLQK